MLPSPNNDSPYKDKTISPRSYLQPAWTIFEEVTGGWGMQAYLFIVSQPWNGPLLLTWINFNSGMDN